MTDYGHELLFGSFLTPDAEDPERVIALAQLSEQAGLDLVTVQDHPYQARFLDAWTLLSVIAARTTRISVSPNVANLPLRPPAVLAKSAASLDRLTGGRVELGIGAGGFWDAISAYGGHRLSAGESVAAFEEAIAVIRGVWGSDGRQPVRVEGEHHRVVGAHPGPAPAHEIGLWVGAVKPRMLRLTGRLGDGWLPSSPYVPPEQLAEANRLIDEGAEAAGRDPRSVRRLYNLGGRFQARAGSGFLEGPPELWAEQLAELTLTEGMSGYIVMGDDPDTLRRFAAEVAPAVREMVATERAGEAAERPEPARPAVAVAERPSLDVFAPTPDDGVRLSPERVWDEATRPTGPAPDPDRDYTAHEVAQGRHLVDVHDHLRQELERVRSLVEEVLAGSTDPGIARSQINLMTMRQNNWTLGAYCESYCRVVTTHHTIESQSMFPYLKRKDPRLAPVVDRLHEEHEAIHEVLERVDRALVAFVGTPGATGEDTAKQLRAAVDLLTDTLVSHLSYEERELLEPLARLGFS